MSDTYVKSNVPHCPKCNSRRVHQVSRWIWVWIWLIISVATSIVLIGLVMLLFTPVAWFIPGYWVCRNCKQKTMDSKMLFKDLEEPKIQGDDSRRWI